MNLKKNLLLYISEYGFDVAMKFINLRNSKFTSVGLITYHKFLVHLQESTNLQSLFNDLITYVYHNYSVKSATYKEKEYKNAECDSDCGYPQSPTNPKEIRYNLKRNVFADPQ